MFGGMDDNLISEKTVKTKEGYILKKSIYRFGNDKDTEVISAYNVDGVYIGSEDFAERLYERGIKPEPINANGNIYGNICSIGFCEAEQKFYGWSHRAIYGFGIGSTVKFGDCAYKADTAENFKKDTDNFWDDTGKPDSRNISYSSHFVTPEEALSLEELIRYKKDYGMDAPVCVVKHEYSSIQDGTGKVLNFSIFSYLPAFGKGEWTAQTLEDAKQMAIDFANGVS